MSNHNGKATASLVLGIIGMLAWCIPLFGFPINLIGIIMGAKGLNSEKQGTGMAGLILSIIGMIFTVINAIYGAYLGATGQMF